MDDSEKKQIAKHVENKKKEIIDHLDAQARQFGDDLADAEKIRYGTVELPPGGSPPGGLAQGVGGAVGGVVNTAGEIVGGVASTGADVVAGVGNIADSVHNEINDFFSNLRHRLGI